LQENLATINGSLKADVSFIARQGVNPINVNNEMPAKNR